MEKIEDFVKLNKALASFMNDFCLLKEKNDLYYLHFYFRKENETKDLPLIKEILNSAKRV